MTTKPATIALGVSGSIAAYKAADLTSKLVRQGHEVQVLMTEAATRLVQPLTFFTLSRQSVITSLWELPDWQPGHIGLAERASLFVIAPATANVIGKLAHGIGDDALTTFALSHTGPMLVVPAMNPRMWANPAVQENIAILRRRGIEVMEPATGPVACGEGGKGRFPEVPEILKRIAVILAAIPPAQASAKTMAHTAKAQRPRILVTAGPTREAIDPVRYISNHSSGKMGFAIAAAAADAGCPATLVAGPVSLPTPPGCRRRDVVSAAEMKAAVLEELPNHEILVMCAAVADYRPASVAAQKIHKSGDTALPLVRTDDILMAVKEARRPGQKIMGFAAETEGLEASALGKLDRKQLDWIVANDVSRTDIGFNADANEVTVYQAGQAPIHLPKMSKAEVAAALLRLLLAETPAPPTGKRAAAARKNGR